MKLSGKIALINHTEEVTCNLTAKRGRRSTRIVSKVANAKVSNLGTGAALDVPSEGLSFLDPLRCRINQRHEVI